VVAKENRVPFYVAAPTSTIDPKMQRGKDIPIEQRKSDEVTSFGGVRTAPEGVRAANPAFDMTPNRYISAIITEKGVAKRPYAASLKRLLAA
jgi:methylthioribose-1-phosphate isomerase